MSRFPFSKTWQLCISVAIVESFHYSFVPSPSYAAPPGPGAYARSRPASAIAWGGLGTRLAIIIPVRYHGALRNCAHVLPVASG